jgi:hypothetical protein
MVTTCYAERAPNVHGKPPSNRKYRIPMGGMEEIHHEQMVVCFISWAKANSCGIQQPQSSLALCMWK